MMNRMPLPPALCVLVLLARPAAAAECDAYLLRLDESNTIVYDCRRPGRDLVPSWITMGSPLDDLSGCLDTASSGTDTALGMAVLRLGSEIGDPLLNLLDNPSLPNRDHAARAVGVVRLPRIGTELYAMYRFTDVYSDRFDTLWHQHRLVTGEPFQGLDTEGSDGLRDEIIGGYRITLARVRADGDVRRYSYWGATPYFFSPIRYAGYRTSHAALLTVDRLDVAIDAIIDAQSRYTAASLPEECTTTRLAATAGWSYAPTGKAYLRVTHDNTLSPGTYVAAGVSDSGLGPFRVQLEGGVDSDGAPRGHAGLTVTLGHSVALAADLTHSIRPRPEALEFLYLDTLVHCKGTSLRTTAVHASVAFEDTLHFPLTAEVWYDYIDLPVWQSVQRGPDTQLTISECRSPAGALTTAGGMLRWHIHGAVAGADLFASGHVTIGDSEENLSVPWRAGIVGYLRSRKLEGLRAELMLDALGPTTQRYLLLPERSIEERTSPARVGLSLSGRIPVVPPFLRRRLRLAVCVEAGPIGLTGSRRSREHPNGNLMGPRIALSGLAAFVKRTDEQP